jgi:hypothetical protein
MFAMNLGVRGGFITTGEWSRRALAESRTLATAGSEAPVELWSSEERGFRDVF